MSSSVPFPQFPKLRPPLPPDYRALYEQEYLANRTSGGLANKIARALEGWMHAHVRAAAVPQAEEVLELGAGSLNHLAWENGYLAYDVVEPFRILYEASENKPRIRQFYDRAEDIPDDRLYDRVLSVAVLEHMLDLPREISLACRHLRDGGVFCAGFPSEGGWLWKMAWRYGTGTAFRLRTGLDYGVLMHHEHVNTAPEIVACIRYFFHDVEVSRFPLPILSGSLYTFVRARAPHRDRVASFLGENR